MAATSRLLRALLATPLVLGLGGLLAIDPAHAATQVTVNTWDELKAAVAQGSDLEITLSRDLVADETITIPSGASVTLIGGKTIYRDAAPDAPFLSMFEVAEGGTLTMGDAAGQNCVNMSGKTVEPMYERIYAIKPAATLDSLDRVADADRRFIIMDSQAYTDAAGQNNRRIYTVGADGIGNFDYGTDITNTDTGVLMTTESHPLVEDALLQVVGTAGRQNKGNAFYNPKNQRYFGLDSNNGFLAGSYESFDASADAAGVDFYFVNEWRTLRDTYYLKDWEQINTFVDWEASGDSVVLKGMSWALSLPAKQVQLREVSIENDPASESANLDTLAPHRYSADELGLNLSDGIDKGGFFISNNNGAVNIACGAFSDFTTGPLPAPTPWSIQDPGVNDWSVAPGTIAPIYNTGSKASFTMTGGTISNNEVGSNDRMSNEKGVNGTVDTNKDGLITFDEVKNTVIGLGDAKEPFMAMDFSNGRYNFGSRSAGAIILNDGATGSLTGATIESNKGDAGAIIVNRSTLTINDGTTIDSNEGLYLGGAINVNSIDGSGVTMNGGRISNNKSVRQGAVYTQGPAGEVGGVFTLNGGSLNGNYSLDKGGAIRVASNGVTLNAGDIYDNKSWIMGGAIYVNGDSPQNSRTLVINDGSIYDNHSVGSVDPALDGSTDDSRVRGFIPGSGGGVWVCPYGTFVFDASRVILDDNSAAAQGVEFFKEVGLGGELIAKGLDPEWINEDNGPLPGDDPVAGTVRLTNGATNERSTTGVNIYNNTSRRGGAIGADGTLIFGALEDVTREHVSLEFEKTWAPGTEEPSEIFVSLKSKASDGYITDLGVYKLSKSAAVPAGEPVPSGEGSGMSVVALGGWKFRLELPTSIQTSQGEEPLLPENLAAGSTIDVSDFKILMDEVTESGDPQNAYDFSLGQVTVTKSETTKQVATTTDTSGQEFTKTVTFTDTTLTQTGENAKAPADAPAPTELALAVSKSFTGADGSDQTAAKRNLFVFKLEEKSADGARTLVSTTKNALDEGAKAVFPAITYTAEGTHTYVITEVPGDDHEIVYDPKSIEVTVTVAKNGNNELVASSEQIVDGLAGRFVNTSNVEQPALEKYVNKGVHSDLAAFDAPFDYDIMAYVPKDADKVVIEDSLVESLAFVSSADEVAAFAMGADNDHKTTVAQSGTQINGAAAQIDGQKLTVTIPDASAYRGQWVRVAFKAVIDTSKRMSLDSLAGDSATIADNAPVLIDGEHSGVKNTASYRVYVKNPDGAFPQDPNGSGDRPKYEKESNTVTVTPPTQDLTVEKRWLGSEGQAIAWPTGAEVTIDVYSVKDGVETLVEGASATLSAGRPSETVTGLPTLVGVTYTVKESGAANGEITVADNVYSVSVSGSTVTNTFNREVPPEPTDGGEITPNANGKIV
ncbi:FctA domain-containing protein, partial [Schaalia hyovaginalis]|uniref:Spy0128 family protein n=1 Tax=Schaalia hyovaginalis TaxID=29316 RepID=UPI0026F21DA2